LRSVGFDAHGLELSPSIVEYAKRAFGVPVLSGPVEEQALESSSLDLILAMDVVEHLWDPVRTLAHCATLLRDDGVFIFQTPCYLEGTTYADLRAQESPFLDQLKSQEHIYLFSRSSIHALLERLGFSYVTFEPAIFAHYDMFLVAARSAMEPLSEEAVSQVLERSAASRLVRALLDLDDRQSELQRSLSKRVADVEFLTSRVGELDSRSAEQSVQIEALRVRAEQAEAEADALRRHLEATEADRAARLEIIERQGRELGRVSTLEADVAYLKERVAASEGQLSRDHETIQHQREDLSNAQAEVLGLEARLSAIRNSRVYRLLRRFNPFRLLDGADDARRL